MTIPMVESLTALYDINWILIHQVCSEALAIASNSKLKPAFVENSEVISQLHELSLDATRISQLLNAEIIYGNARRAIKHVKKPEFLVTVYDHIKD